MRCSDCGTEVADGWSTCPACGVSLSDRTGETATGAGRRSGNTRSGGRPGGRGGGEPTQPAQASGQPTNEHGQPSAGGHGQSQTGGHGQPQAGGQGPPGGSGQHETGAKAQYQQPQATASGLRTLYDTYLADLPVAGGLVAGALVYLVGFVVTAAVGFAVVEAAGGTADLDVVAELFHNAHFSTLTGLDVSYSGLPATLGLAFVFLPYMLFVSGARFGAWQAYDGIGLTEQVLAGTTVVVGYLPAVAVGAAVLSPGSDPFPPNYAGILLVAGVLYPLICGGIGGATSYFFGEFGGLRARATGALTGVAVAGLTVAAVFVSVDAGAQSEPLALGLVSAVAYVAGHLFAVDGDGAWFTVVLVPLVFVAGVGYLRARRSGVTEWVDGIRAGGSFAFGYSVVTLVALVVLSVFTDFQAEIAGELGGETLAVFADASQQATLSAALSPPQFLEWFVVIGVLYPLVIGGGAGMLHVLIQRTLSDDASRPSNS